MSRLLQSYEAADDYPLNLDCSGIFEDRRRLFVSRLNREEHRLFCNAEAARIDVVDSRAQESGQMLSS